MPQLACTTASIFNSFSSDSSPAKPVLLKHWGWPTAEAAHRYSWCGKGHPALRLPKSWSFVYYNCIRPIPAKILLHFHIKFHMLVLTLKVLICLSPIYFMDLRIFQPDALSPAVAARQWRDASDCLVPPHAPHVSSFSELAQHAVWFLTILS